MTTTASQAAIDSALIRAEYAENRALELAKQLGLVRTAAVTAGLALYHARSLTCQFDGKCGNTINVEVNDAIKLLEQDPEIKEGMKL